MAVIQITFVIINKISDKGKLASEQVAVVLEALLPRRRWLVAVRRRPVQHVFSAAIRASRLASGRNIKVDLRVR